MGKQLQKQDSNLHFRSNHHGCLWTILGFLDYHQWHGVKNLFPLKSHVRLSLPKGNGTSKTGLEDHDIVAAPEYFDKEAQTLLVEQQTTETVRRQKNSGKSHIEVSVAKEMIEEDSVGYRNLRHSLGDVNKRKTDRREPFQQKISKNLYECNNTAKKGRLEKQDKEVGPSNRFHSRNSCGEVCLTKSMSFPAVSSSGVRFYRSCTLENKRYESFPKRKNVCRSLRQSKFREWNQEVVNRLNVIKQKMKQTFKEKRSKAISPLPTIDTNRTEIPESLDHLTMVENGENNIKSVDETNGTVHSIESIFFPYDSLERYKDLFGETINDKTKNRQSRCLALRSLGKNRLARYEKHQRETDRNSVSTIGIADGFQPLEELELENRIDEPDELIEDELSVEDERIMYGIAEKNHSEELVSHGDDKDFGQQSNQILDIQTCSTELPISEGMEPESSAIDRKIVSDNRHDWSSSDSIAAYSSCIDHENTVILELSWLIESEAVGAHRSVSKSMSSLLDELKGHGKEAGWELDQQLLVDLVTEALHDINETSSTCFNKAFSFSPHILPRPTGKRLVRELQKRVGVHFRPGHGSPEEFMAGDLCRDDDWMKNQLEAERLALEVEGLILDQLVDEVIS